MVTLLGRKNPGSLEASNQVLGDKKLFRCLHLLEFHQDHFVDDYRVIADPDILLEVKISQRGAILDGGKGRVQHLDSNVFDALCDFEADLLEDDIRR